MTVLSSFGMPHAFLLLLILAFCEADLVFCICQVRIANLKSNKSQTVYGTDVFVTALCAK